MKLKKIILGSSTIFTSLLILAGCSNNSSRPKPKETEKVAKVEKKKSIKKRPQAKKKEVKTNNKIYDKIKENSQQEHKPQKNSTVAEKQPAETKKWVVNGAPDAEPLLTKKFGDQGWTTMGGTFGGAHSGFDENGNPNPVPKDYIPYVSVTNRDHSLTYIVYGDGRIEKAPDLN